MISISFKNAVTYNSMILTLYFILLVVSRDVFCDDSSSYEIDEINFKYVSGETFDKKTLLDLMTLPKKKEYNHHDLEKDMQVLKKYYFDNGFFNSIIDTATEYNDEDQTVNITVIILEKNRYKLNKIKYLGLESVDSRINGMIYKDQLIKSGNFYDRSSIISESNRILEILANNGYPFAQVDTSQGTLVEKSLVENSVNLQLSFLNAKTQYSFGKTRVNISNNKYKLPNKLILRELDYKEGELFNKEHIIRSERNFSNFRIIQSARIQIDSVIESNHRINYVVNVNLTNKYEVTPSLIGTDIDNQFYVGAEVDYSDKNFFGGGRVFSTGISGYFHSKTVNLAEIKATFFQPYFFSNITTATYEVRLGIYNFTDKLQYLILRNSFRVLFSLPDYTFYNRMTTDVTADLVRLKSKETDSTNPAIVNTVISNLVNSILGITLIHDNTNDIFNPSKGFYHSITAENAGLLPKLLTLLNSNIDYSQYVKLLTLNKVYFDLSGKRKTSIIATFNRIGDIIEYGKGSNIVPVSPIYKFFSGGSSSLRGWNAKENGILDDPTLGGTFIFEGSLEHRLHLFVNNDNFLKNIWFAYFVDYGNVWDKDKHFRLNEIALATGFGFRYNTFVGPIRIDFGFKLYDPKAPAESKWLFDKKSQIFHQNKVAFQFGLGNAF